MCIWQPACWVAWEGGGTHRRQVNPEGVGDAHKVGGGLQVRVWLLRRLILGALVHLPSPKEHRARLSGTSSRNSSPPPPTSLHTHMSASDARFNTRYYA